MSKSIKDVCQIDVLQCNEKHCCSKLIDLLQSREGANYLKGRDTLKLIQKSLKCIWTFWTLVIDSMSQQMIFKHL